MPSLGQIIEGIVAKAKLLEKRLKKYKVIVSNKKIW